MYYMLAPLFLLSWLLTLLIRRYALTNNKLDHPNHRSSHIIPTPSGGGLAFVIVFLLIIPLAYYSSYLSLSDSIALFCSGLLLAIVGFLDDSHPISARMRLCIQFIAGAWALYWLGGFPTISLLGIELTSGWLMDGLALVYLVWLINLYNFMDGIDGLAGLEAISVCLCAVLIYFYSNKLSMTLMPLSLALGVAGFLYWNFPKARIFMGDVGSGFLGFILGVFSIQAASIQQAFFWSWLILLGVFIVDATYTLLHRLIRGCRVFDAHRSHAYQYASIYLGQHYLVSSVVVIINLFWLFPIAWLVSLNDLDGVLGLIIAYIPLVIACFFLRAGQGKLSISVN